MDLDDDGVRDLLSGSWPGEIYIFKGKDGGEFAPPRMLKEKNDEIINVGGGVEERDDMILITGHCEWKQDEETKEHYVLYRGKKYVSTPDKQVASTGCATHVHAADWDGDGDLDLIVGDIRGSVHLIPNEGSAKKPAFGAKQRLQAGGTDLRADGDAGPFTVDWDGDGDLDLLCGDDAGKVVLFANTGSRTKPKLADAVTLVEKGVMVYGEDVPSEPTRGGRSKVCATDWNGDGKLDLLVGDVNYQKPKPKQMSEEEKKQLAADKARLAELGQRRGELFMKMRGADRVTDKKELAKIQEELEELGEEAQDLHDNVPQPTTHGYVWLFVQK